MDKAAPSSSKNALNTSASGPPRSGSPQPRSKTVAAALGAAFGNPYPNAKEKENAAAKEKEKEPSKETKTHVHVAPQASSTAKSLWSCEDSERWVCHRKGATNLAPVWQADTVSSQCSVCKTSFGLWVRKHHCRMCGFVICEDCSKHRVALPQLGYKGEVRVCDQCFEKVTAEAGSEAFTAHAATTSSASLSSLASGPLPHPYSQPPSYPSKSKSTRSDTTAASVSLLAARSGSLSSVSYSQPSQPTESAHESAKGGKPGSRTSSKLSSATGSSDSKEIFVGGTHVSLQRKPLPVSSPPPAAPPPSPTISSSPTSLTVAAAPPRSPSPRRSTLTGTSDGAAMRPSSTTAPPRPVSVSVPSPAPSSSAYSEPIVEEEKRKNVEQSEKLESKDRKGSKVQRDSSRANVVGDEKSQPLLKPAQLDQQEAASKPRNDVRTSSGLAGLAAAISSFFGGSPSSASGGAAAPPGSLRSPRSPRSPRVEAQSHRLTVEDKPPSPAPPPAAPAAIALLLPSTAAPVSPTIVAPPAPVVSASLTAPPPRPTKPIVPAVFPSSPAAPSVMPEREEAPVVAAEISPPALHDTRSAPSPALPKEPLSGGAYHQVGGEEEEEEGGAHVEDFVLDPEEGEGESERGDKEENAPGTGAYVPAPPRSSAATAYSAALSAPVTQQQQQKQAREQATAIQHPSPFGPTTMTASALTSSTSNAANSYVEVSAISPLARSSSAALVPAQAIVPSPAPSLRSTLDSSANSLSQTAYSTTFEEQLRTNKSKKNELKVLSYAAVAYSAAATQEDEAKTAKEVEEKITALKEQKEKKKKKKKKKEKKEKKEEEKVKKEEEKGDASGGESSGASSPFPEQEQTHPGASTTNSLHSSLRAMPADQLKAALLALTGQQLHGHATTSVDVSALFRSLHSSSGSTTGSEMFRGGLFSHKDWNREFQDQVDLQLPLMNSPDFCSIAAFQDSQFRLSALVNDFRNSAVTYGKVIISELPLPVSLKSIKPAAVGGVAGGEKYVVAGILFKFALDQNIANDGDPALYLYGGPKPEDELAAKAAGRELNGACWIAAVSGAAKDRVRVPLMCLIDFRGFRLIASSVLPIGKDTLRYGSQDAGHTVHADIEQLNNSMKIIMERLSLAPHLVGYKVSNEIYGPGDIEGHQGRDGQFYSVDFARLFPPEAPSLDPKERAKHRRGVFYRMLRAEAIMRQPLALSSDAFSGWSTVDPLRLEHERDVRTVTTWVYNQVIPKFAAFLDQQCAENPDASFLRTFKVADMMHQHGINMRHLGKLRTAAQRKEVKDWCLTEATARVCKCFLRGQMRTCLLEQQNIAPGEVPIKMLINDMINKLCSSTRAAWCKHTAVLAVDFWSQMKEKLVAKFSDIFAEKEELDASAIDAPYIISYLQTSLHFTLSPYLLSMVAKRDMSFESTVCDILSLEVRVKEMFIGKSASAYFLYGQSKSYHNNSDAIRLLEEAEHQLRDAWNQVPTSALLNLQYGIILAELAQRKNDLSVYDRAYEMFNLCLRAVPLSEAIAILIDVKIRHGTALRQGGQDAEAKELDDQIDALRQLLPRAKTIKDVFDFADT